MAGPGSGPASAGAPTPQPGEREIPRAVLRSWDEAEARLFPMVMARPDLYQQSVSMIQRLLALLRETCPDLPSLLAAHERGGDLAADLSAERNAPVDLPLAGPAAKRAAA